MRVTANPEDLVSISSLPSSDILHIRRAVLKGERVYGNEFGLKFRFSYAERLLC